MRLKKPILSMPAVLGLALFLDVTSPVAADTPAVIKPSSPAEGAEFFESKIRPILADNCFTCHGSKKQKAGFRLDSRTALIKGSDNGPVVVPGQPEKSKLIQAINYGGDPQMPPKGKLPQQAIDALTAWVKMGVPWPESAGPSSVDADPEAWKTHWAFQPIGKPPLPSVENSSWVKSPLDAFILAKLEDKGLSPALPADRRTLIRRAYFDLLGLPPSEAEIDAFVADPAP